jgi:ABC-type nitrate/sulfonate/bicarbonate transport system permease component
MPLLLTVAILATWEALVRFLAIPKYVLPTPSEIALEIVFDGGMIFRQLQVTLFEIFCGYALSALVGFCLSVLIVYSPAFRRGVLPLIVASQTIPVIAMAPAGMDQGTGLGDQQSEGGDRGRTSAQSRDQRKGICRQSC